MVWSQDLIELVQLKSQLTYDDVQIVPEYSEVESRDNVDTTARLTTNFALDIPLVAAPMDTVCDEDMMSALIGNGASGALHRFMDVMEQGIIIRSLARRTNGIIVASIGATGDYQERAEVSLENGAHVILIDVAHGDHIHVRRAMKWLNSLGDRRSFDVIAGNIATADAALRLQEWGADALRVGIGGGSMCETRIRTGIGIPQLAAVMDVAAAAQVPVIADGGIRHPGDVAKALAAGADTVMLGSMLAGTDEAPGEVIVQNGRQWKKFRGSASAEQKIMNNKEVKNVEGASGLVSYKGSVNGILNEIMDGVRSAMSYVGATNLQELHTFSRFIRITNAGLREAHPHGLL